MLFCVFIELCALAFIAIFLGISITLNIPWVEEFKGHPLSNVIMQSDLRMLVPDN